MRYKKLLFFLVILVIFTSGCSRKVTEITAPPDNITLDEATKINLKMLDLNKLSKTDITQLDGIKFKDNTVGYEMEYRYPDTPIKIKIIKFTSQDEIETFWLEWLAVHKLEQFKTQQVVEFNQYNNYSSYAWQKGPWFTYISVPNEPLKDKVKNVIANHYLNLAKKESLIK
ncbi:MAG: hypothetical protein VR72_06005 [Clostridiaceae bacterium BRH_c20a]|nr:MAG: hypothetical protein VR72_06005 [Clostridiaceae bacterium BRH_c20a]